MTTKTLTVRPEALRSISIEQAQGWHNDLVKATQDLLVKDQDFGIIPGVQKPSLLKAGAEKLRMLFGLSIKMETTESTVNLKDQYVSYTYKCTVKSPSGKILSQCEGNCNSYETKYRFIWVKENDVPENLDKAKLAKRQSSASEFVFAINKGETTGPYGKPAEYWQKFRDAKSNGTARIIKKQTKKGEMDALEIGDTSYRIPNPDVIGLQNTVMKMAQKRAMVGAVLIATGASQFYTQDVEDLKEFAEVIDDSHTPTVQEGVVVTEPAVAKSKPTVVATPVKAVQDEPTEPTEPTVQAPVAKDYMGTHEKRIKWIQKLVDSKALVVDEPPETLSEQDALKIWSDYLVKIGKA